MSSHVTRRTLLVALGGASLAGCLGGSPNPGSSGGGTDRSERTADGTDGTAAPTTTADTPPLSTAEERLPLPMEPDALRQRAVSGGPPKDGIPSIDDPTFVSATEADAQIDPGDPVFGVALGGEKKAYPQSILAHHEICNDVVDGTPVSVTYCPLTGTAMGFLRGETTFGVSGRLINNNLIMYDRATETWWPQVLSTSIPGPWNESPPVQSLSGFRVVWTTWERWSDAHPDTAVLSRETGFARNYSRDPYGSYNPRSGYYRPDSNPMFPSFSDDDRLDAKAVVIGARTAAGAVAFGKDALRIAGLLRGKIGGEPVVAAYEPRLDTGYLYRTPDADAFEYRDGRVVDATGETHDPTALPGERLLALDAMWFAWSGFYPETTLYV